MPLFRPASDRPWRPTLGLLEGLAVLCWLGLGAAVAQAAQGLVAGVAGGGGLPVTNPDFSLPPPAPTPRRLRTLETFEIRARRPISPPALRESPRAPEARSWVYASQEGDPRGQLHIPALRAGLPAAPPDPGAAWLSQRPRLGAPGRGAPVATQVRAAAPAPLGADRASYRFSLEELAAGRLPAPAAVHPESFVASVSTRASDEHRLVARHGPVGVAAELADHPLSPGHHLLRVTVSGQGEPERPPVHLVVVVDDSGSMALEGRRALVVEALEGLWEGLRPDDTLAVLRYDHEAEVLLAPGPPRPEARAAVLARLKADGASAMGVGLDAAWRLAGRLPRTGQRSVVLLTDGDANVGVQTRSRWLKQVRAWRTAGVGFTVATVGDGVRPSPLIREMVAAGEGRQLVLSQRQDRSEALRRPLLDALAVAATDLSASVEFNSAAVARWRLLGWGPSTQGGVLPQIAAGQTATVVYELELQDPVPGPLGVLSLAAATSGMREVHGHTLSGAPIPFAEASAVLHRAFVAGRFGELLRDRDADGLTELSRLVDALRRPGHPEDSALLAQVRRAAALAGRPRLQAGEPRVQGAVREQAEQLQYCYQSAHNRRPGIRGELVLELKVYAGRVTAVGVLEQSTGDRVLEACGVRKAQRWRFPRDLDADVVVAAAFAPPSAEAARHDRSGRTASLSAAP